MSLSQSVKASGGGSWPGHAGVIEMAMGVDEAGQEDDFAEIGRGNPARRRGMSRHRPTETMRLSATTHRAVLDGRARHGQDDAGAQNAGATAAAEGELRDMRIQYMAIRLSLNQ